MKTSQAMPTGTTPVATRLDARLLARSEASAKRLGLTMSGLLQVSLSTYLDGQDQLVAVAEIAQAAAAIRRSGASQQQRFEPRSSRRSTYRSAQICRQ